MSGSYNFEATQFLRSAAPDGPYGSLDIGLQVISKDPALDTATQPYLINRNMTESATPCTLDALGTSSGTCTATRFVVGATVRYGRIKLQNTYGSERLALKMPLAFEYWTSNGWQKNSLDTCSVKNISSSNFAFEFSKTSKAPLKACDTTLSNPGSAPNYVLTLSAPNPRTTGWADIKLNLDSTNLGTQCTPGVSAGTAAVAAPMPWLQYSGVNPKARATFGIFKSPLIYRRENY